MNFGVVIPFAPGREENLSAVMGCLAHQTLKPRLVVIVYDGATSGEDIKLELPESARDLEVAVIPTPKHRPGFVQPRNKGVHLIEQKFPEISHVAFLDSDIIVHPDWLAQYEAAINNGGAGGIYYGPYDWLPPGVREVDPALRNDPRTEMFLAEQRDRDETSKVRRYVSDLSKGLGCFSGNLVWNVADFAKVGGFWNELHAGRCEDGELGLRATAMGIPIGLVPEARGWHLWHGGAPAPTAEWTARAVAMNEIDVPKLNNRHPWVEGRCACGHEREAHEGHDEEGSWCLTADCECERFAKVLFVVEEDGKRFNARCKCGWEGNTALVWQHERECPA